MFPKRLLLMLIALALCLGAALPASAAEQEPEWYVQQIIHYYNHYQQDAREDIDLLLSALEDSDPELADAWRKIVDYWDYVGGDWEPSFGVLPDGLPEDDSLCIVVLGYALAADGSMREELIGRMKVALASAQKYPNAYILCTGGPTASEKPKTSEAEAMAKWLIYNGISEDRIILEEESLSTAQNAIHSCEILFSQYPQVRHLALVTSDYHIRRGCLVFYTQAALSAAAGTGWELDIVGTAAHAVYGTYHLIPSSFSQQVYEVSRLAGVTVEDLSTPEHAVLTGIYVTGNTVFPTGQEPDLQVYAEYSTGFSRNVSRYVKFSGFDLAKEGTQAVIVSYTEGNRTMNTSAIIEFKGKGVVLPTDAPTETTLPAETEPAPAPVTEDNSSWGWILIPVFLGAGVLVWLFWRNEKKKHRRRRKKMYGI